MGFKISLAGFCAGGFIDFILESGAITSESGSKPKDFGSFLVGLFVDFRLVRLDCLVDFALLESKLAKSSDIANEQKIHATHTNIQMRTNILCEKCKMRKKCVKNLCETMLFAIFLFAICLFIESLVVKFCCVSTCGAYSSICRFPLFLSC